MNHTEQSLTLKPLFTNVTIEDYGYCSISLSIIHQTSMHGLKNPVRPIPTTNATGIYGAQQSMKTGNEDHQITGSPFLGAVHGHGTTQDKNIISTYLRRINQTSIGIAVSFAQRYTRAPSYSGSTKELTVSG